MIRYAIGNMVVCRTKEAGLIGPSLGVVIATNQEELYVQSLADKNGSFLGIPGRRWFAKSVCTKVNTLKEALEELCPKKTNGVRHVQAYLSQRQKKADPNGLIFERRARVCN